MEKFLILVIFSLLFFPIISKHIKFNFRRLKDIYSDDDEELSMNILENNIFCDIDVGNQKIPFFIAFDKELTFIMDDNYTYAKFSKSKSKTFQKNSQLPNSYVFDNIRFGYNATDKQLPYDIMLLSSYYGYLITIILFILFKDRIYFSSVFNFTSKRVFKNL